MSTEKTVFEELDNSNVNGDFESDMNLQEIYFTQGSGKCRRSVTILLKYLGNKQYTLSISQKPKKVNGNNVYFILEGKFFLFLSFNLTEDIDLKKKGGFVLSRIQSSN